MKKTLIMAMAISAVIPMALPMVAGAEGTTWKLGTIYNDPDAKPDYNSFGNATKKFCDLVNEKTEGVDIL